MGGRCQHPQIEALRSQLAQWEGAAWRHALADPSSRERAAVISSGCPALDRILPQHGFRCGTFVEWLSSGPGDGAATLAFRAAAEALKGTVPFSPTSGPQPVSGCHDTPTGSIKWTSQKLGQSPGRAVVVLDSSGEFYPPAAIAQGIEPSRLIVVHPENSADHAWALDQALRCPAVAATVAWPDGVCSTGFSRNPNDIPPKGGTTSAFRRWQLAAEQGGGLGLLIRPAAVRGEPSWADVRLLVEPLLSDSPSAIKGTVPICRNGPEGAAHKWGLSPLLPRRMRIILLRCRSCHGEQTVEVEIDDEPYPASFNPEPTATATEMYTPSPLASG